MTTYLILLAAATLTAVVVYGRHYKMVGFGRRVLIGGAIAGASVNLLFTLATGLVFLGEAMAAASLGWTLYSGVKLERHAAGVRAANRRTEATLREFAAQRRRARERNAPKLPAPPRKPEYFTPDQLL